MVTIVYMNPLLAGPDLAANSRESPTRATLTYDGLPQS